MDSLFRCLMPGTPLYTSLPSIQQSLYPPHLHFMHSNPRERSSSILHRSNKTPELGHSSLTRIIPIPKLLLKHLPKLSQITPRFYSVSSILNKPSGFRI